MTTTDQHLAEALDAVRSFSPKLAELTADTLFGDVLSRPGLTPRERSLATVAGLIASGNVEQLRFHAPRALALGVTRDELSELTLQMAFYAGWPRVMSAVTILNEVLSS